MAHNKNILILYDNKLFSINDFRKTGVEAYKTFKKLSFILRVARRVFKFFNLTQKYWYADWKRHLLFIKTVIIFAPYELSELQFIKKANKNIRIIYWCWNPNTAIGQLTEDLFKLTEIWSFDPEDCIKFGLKYNSTFYFSNISLPKNNIEYDAIFIGINKGRRNYLNTISDLLKRNNVMGYFHIVPDKGEEYLNDQFKEIPYAEYLEVLSKSKAIIDIKAFGQSGLTVRPMESIFFKKKLITNDPRISLENFYHPQNIFILGKDDENYLKEFIDLPFSQLNEDIVAYYDFNNWLERFDKK